MSHQTSVCSPVVVLFCLAASSLTSSAHVSLVFLTVSPNHPTRAVPLRYSFLILTSHCHLVILCLLLSISHKSTLTLVSTHLHLVCTLVFTTVSFSFAHMYSVLLRLTFIPLLSRGYLHLSRVSSICCAFIDSSKSSFHLPNTHFSLFISLITLTCC